MDVVRLMGIETRSWTDKNTGELKTFNSLHVVHESPTKEGVKGKSCESFSCPQDLNLGTLQLNQTYELQYEHYRMKDGLHARISNLVPCKP